MNPSTQLLLLAAVLYCHGAKGMPTNAIFLKQALTIQVGDARCRVGSVGFSPDDRILASGSGGTESLGSHGEIKLWNASNGVLVAELKGHRGLVDALKFSPDGKIVAGGGYSLIIWDVERHKKLKTLKPGSLVHALDFSPDGRLLISACRGQPYAQVWEVETGRQTTRLEVGTSQKQTVWSVDYSPDGRVVALGGANQSASIWDAGTWTRQGILSNASELRRSAWLVKFSRTGTYLFTKGDFRIPGRFWDTANRQVVRELGGDNEMVSDLDFSPDGMILATAGMERLNLWDAGTGRLIRSLKGKFESVAFSHDGQLLAVGSYGGMVQVYRVTHEDLLD